MKFVADENIERPIILFLRSEGYDVFSVAESCVGITDEEILRMSNQEDRILLTNDKDFGELIFHQKRVTSGILLIRSSIDKSETKLKLVRQILTKIGDKLEGNFVVIYEGGYRLRHL